MKKYVQKCRQYIRDTNSQDDRGRQGTEMIKEKLLTEQDKKSNYEKLYALMDEQQLEGLFVSGDAAMKYANGEFAVGWGVFGLIPRHGTAIFFQGNEGREYILTPVKKNIDNYWIKEYALMTIPNVIKAFHEKGMDGKRVGFNTEAMPFGLYETFSKALDFVDIVDISDKFRQQRRIKGGGYLNIIEEAIDIVDTCVRELPELLHTGMYEMEVKAILQNMMLSRGAEDSLILLNADKTDISAPAIPSDHLPVPIKKGDKMVVEITVCFRGCWLQKIAIYSFGEPEQEYIDMFNAVDEAIWTSVKTVKPGTNAKDLVNAIDDYIEQKGFLSGRKDFITGPCGHLSGYEMDEATFSYNRDFILQDGMLFVLHPGAAMPGWEEGKPGIFGPGTMFLVTKDGVKSLNKTSNEIYIVER